MNASQFHSNWKPEHSWRPKPSVKVRIDPEDLVWLSFEEGLYADITVCMNREQFLEFASKVDATVKALQEVRAA